MLKANGKKECKSVQMQQKWVLISETSIMLFTMVHQEIQTICMALLAVDEKLKMKLAPEFKVINTALKICLETY